MKLITFFKTLLLAGLFAASSAVNAQQNVYLYNDSTGEYFLMSGAYPLYTYVGNVSNGALYFNPEEWTCCLWDYAVQSFPNGTFNGCCANGDLVPPGYYLVTLNWETGEYSFEVANCADVINAEIPLEIDSTNLTPQGCPTFQVYAPGSYSNFTLQWFRNGTAIVGANQLSYIHPNNLPGNFSYTLQATCSGSGNILSNAINVNAPSSSCYNDISSPLDYMLVQNVTTTGNLPGQSIQVQFDLSWGNTWKDDINWDAAWVFMKYKNAQGLWKHAKLSPTGHDNGQGTPNVIEPTSDQMGAFIRLATEGQGNFNAEGLQ
ncbi:MAG: hypothetical protein ACKOW8_05190, partial [Flavobacteriales bacterium]